MNNEQLKQIIIDSFHEKKNSHAFLMSTNNLSKCYEDIKDICKKINCDTGKDNCECNICHTIDINSNPDYIVVYPDGKEIKKDQVLNIINQFVTKPTINKYSTYVISEADKMNESSANKILKFLEEPEENIIGFFITERLQSVLPTIRSRCEIFDYSFSSNNILDYLEINEEEYGKVFDLCMKYNNMLIDSPKFMLMTESKKLSKLERDEIDLFFKVLKKFYILKYEYLMYNKYYNLDFIRNIIDLINTDDINIIVKRIKLLDNVCGDLKINVNKELVFNNFFLLWE